MPMKGKIEPFDPVVDDWERLRYYYVANEITVEDKTITWVLVRIAVTSNLMALVAQG